MTIWRIALHWVPKATNTHHNMQYCFSAAIMDARTRLCCYVIHTYIARLSNFYIANLTQFQVINKIKSYIGYQSRLPSSVAFLSSVNKFLVTTVAGVLSVSSN